MFRPCLHSSQQSVHNGSSFSRTPNPMSLERYSKALPKKQSKDFRWLQNNSYKYFGKFLKHRKIIPGLTRSFPVAVFWVLHVRMRIVPLHTKRCLVSLVIWCRANPQQENSDTTGMTRTKRTIVNANRDVRGDQNSFLQAVRTVLLDHQSLGWGSVDGQALYCYSFPRAKLFLWVVSFSEWRW